MSIKQLVAAKAAVITESDTILFNQLRIEGVLHCSATSCTTHSTHESIRLCREDGYFAKNIATFSRTAQ